MADLSHPDGTLISLGKLFEKAKAQARKLDPDRMASFSEYQASKAAAGIPDLPCDQSPEQQALLKKIYRESGYAAANDTFNRMHSECIRLMKAIHRTRATTLEGFAVKAAAIAFDQSDFDLATPKPADIAERMLYRLARDMAKAVKMGGAA